MQKQKIEVLVVKDETGELRPLAGIWRNNPVGKINADIYAAKDKNISIVECELIEK